MAEDQLSDKIENTIISLKQIVIRTLRTFYLFTVNRSEFVKLLGKQERSDQIMHPNSFLLICAITLGFSGKILAQGVKSINFDTILAIKDLTLSSFLNHSLPVFALALVASVIIGKGLRKQNPGSIRCIKDLNYYFIGYFGISSLIILVLLALFLPGNFFDPKTKLFIRVSYLLLAGFVLLIFFFVQSSSWQILKNKGSNTLGAGVFMKLAFVNGLVIALCIANFLSPMYRYGVADKLSGTLLDLEISNDHTVKVTYAIENQSMSTVTINRIDSHKVTVVYGDNERIEREAWSAPGCGKGSPTVNFQQVKPDEAIILMSYVCEDRFLEVIKSSFEFVNRSSDKKKALITDSMEIDIVLNRGHIELELTL